MYVGCCYQAKLYTRRLVHGWLNYSGAQGGCLGCITAPARPTHSTRASLSPRTVGVRPSDRSRCGLRVWLISCIGKILIYLVPRRPVHSSPFHPSSGCRMATHFMIAHKAVPHGCRHLSLTTMCYTIPTSPAMTPVSPHSEAGQQKQTLPPPGMPYGDSFHASS